MKYMDIDVGILESILTDTLREVSQWVEASCGCVPIDSKLTVGVEATDIHQAVTQVDLELQERILKTVYAKFPDVIPLVEETTDTAKAYKDNRGPVAFILDPIDGTQSFAHGRHDYSTLAAVSIDGRLVFGLVSRYHPFNLRFARLECLPQPKKGTCPTTIKVVCHYRLFREPFKSVIQQLAEGGCELSSVPLSKENYSQSSDSWQTGPGLGSNGTAIMALIDGLWDAYIGPMVTLHDFAGPWCIASSSGATVIQFRNADINSPGDWVPCEYPKFYIPSACQYPFRYRVLIARNSAIADRLLNLLQGS